ncbi:MAG: hypothetical protein ACR2RB_15785 [Gammaproteobacteria bacterium]
MPSTSEIPGIGSASSVTPISRGGTGATSATGARTNLGLGTASTRDTGTQEGNVPLIGAGNQLDAALIPPPAPGTVPQASLKTATGTLRLVSTANIAGQREGTLPGGSYGFTPRVSAFGATNNVAGAAPNVLWSVGGTPGATQPTIRRGSTWTRLRASWAMTPKAAVLTRTMRWSRRR